MKTAKRSRIRDSARAAAVFAIVAGLSASGLTGCATTSRTKKGAAIGGATGAAIGAIIGKQTDNTGKGAVIGGAAGAVVGGIIGQYMDKQAEELAKIEGAKTERIGEEIRVTYQSAILFDFDSAMLKLASQENIGKMGTVFQEYPETDIIIAGHTDSRGPEEYNQKLSERRAKAVRDYLVNMGVQPSRIETVGYGELYPVAENDTSEGRSLNRRVQIEIRANEALKARAEKEAKRG